MGRYKKLVKALRQIIDYPNPGVSRCTEDGYPTEFAYDEFAYRRIIDSYRDALTKAIKDTKKVKGE
jgi:hypothetical protein